MDKKFYCECEYCGKPFSDYKSNRGYVKPKYCSQKCYHAASRSEKEKRKCEICGAEFWVMPWSKKRFCSTKCVAEHRGKIAKHKTYTNDKGYKYIWIHGRGNVPEHVYIMENKIGRMLKLDEVVHHIDEDVTNNNINNLKLMTRSQHSSLHRKKELKNNKKLFGGKVGRRFKKGNVPHNRKPVICIETGIKYESATECGEQMNINPSLVSRVCIGNRKSTHGFHFRYSED